MGLPSIPIPRFLKSVKYGLAGVNGAFLVTGFLLLFVGIGVLVIYSEYDDLTTKQFITLPGFVIATGIIIILGSGLGFYAALSKQFYFILGYVGLLIVVLVFEVSMVIVAFALTNSAVSDIREPMLTSLQLYSSRVDVMKIWDDLQMSFQCCGAVNRFDWLTNRIPISCCYINYGTVSPFACTSANSYIIGCVQALGDWLAYNAFVIAVTSLVVTCIQVPITAIAGWLAYRSKGEVVELES